MHFLTLILAFASTFAESAPLKLQSIEVRPFQEMKRLLAEQDADHDLKITLEDLQQRKKIRKEFTLRDTSNLGFSVSGTYPLSNLLQELKLASEKAHSAAEAVPIQGDRIFENPVTRLSRMIREVYWSGLTRIIDRDHLKDVLGDSKVSSAYRYLYVPFRDQKAFEYFSQAAIEMPNLKMKVVKLPEQITPAYVKSLDGKHGLLALKLGAPYVVPGGRFNEMYGWDSYFEGLGLIADGRVLLAQAMVDHFVYEIQNYGKILNANRTYYLTRSQPPFLPSFIRAVREALPENEQTHEWLKASLAAAIQEYQNVWMGKDRLTETGLSRYAGEGLGIPPEVEPGHFDSILAPYAAKRELSLREYAKRYDSGLVQEPELDAFFSQDRAVRESGHDTTYRWRVNGKDRCADFVTVDLNSLLYKAELEIAGLIEKDFKGKFEAKALVTTAQEWREKAAHRKKLMLALLWDPAKKLFFDYDFNTKKRSAYVSATTLYPLWAWDPTHPETRFLSEVDTAQLVKNALVLLEMPGGLAATAEASLKTMGDPKNPRQWEFPNGWAPHQMLIWTGLEQVGMKSLAERLIYKWLYMITKNAMDYQGTIPEKYDVVKRSHQVFAEYGNVGTTFSYITREGFGWMNASYQVGLQKLPLELRTQLEAVIPPEWVFALKIR